MTVEDFPAKNLGRVPLAPVCDACGKPFRTGSVKLEDLIVVGALCQPCNMRRIIENA